MFYSKNKNPETKGTNNNENIFFKKKKSLGQNFLKSQKALFEICRAGQVEKGDTIIEIGPGKGALTEKLLERGAFVIAIEKDQELIPILNTKFENEIKQSRLIIANEDILKYTVPKKINNYKIIANIPYNITGAIIKKFLEEEKKPLKMALLVQKEVAERIVAKDKKESVLSISVKSYGKPSYIMTVNKRYFSPAPKVDSAIVLIDNISNQNFKKRSSALFFDLVKEGFSHKRKVLINNISKKASSRESLEKIFLDLKINEKIRPENISIDQWFLIFDKII